MRVVIVVPRQPDTTGNHITAVRHRTGLQALGYRVELIEAAPGEPFPATRMNRFHPDIVHLLHAFRAGAPWLACGSNLPFVVTLTGTDVHAGLGDAAQGEVILEVLRRAAAVITQNRLTFAHLQRDAKLSGRLHWLPPGIVIGDAPYDLQRHIGATPEAIVFLHPAGIRPVKRNLELLHLCDPLAAACPGFRLIFCGPILDPDYGGRFQMALAKRPWAAWIGAVPPSAMPALMRQADVVLNHSSCEGLPNALLEASALGRPILAHAIDGNAAIVDDGSNGLLYAEDSIFLEHALALLENPALRRHLSRPRPELYDPLREAENLAAIYASSLRRS